MVRAHSVKGMVLAAGLGTRLRPITDEYPKPLVPIFGVNPLGLAIQQLRTAGIQQIAVNTHYQAEKIDHYLTRFSNIKISYEPTLLGTGGAYNPIRSWIGESHLAIINGDIVSTIDVEYVVNSHLKSNAIATMVILPEVIPGESGVAHQNGRISGIGKYGKKSPKEGNFGCMQVLSPRFFNYLPEGGSFDIISTAYKRLLQEDQFLAAIEFNGMWHDIRSPKYYFAALKDIAEKWPSLELARTKVAVAELGVSYEREPSAGLRQEPIVVHGAKVHSTANLGFNTFIEEGATVEGDTTIENSLVLGGATVKKGSLINYKILGKNFLIDLA